MDGVLGITNHSAIARPIPTQWLEDETIHSLCVRHHLLAGNTKPGDTMKQLFGRINACGIDHNFPTAIDALVERSSGRLGSSEAIIRDHSILPAFLPFLSEDVQARAFESMRASRFGTHASIVVGAVSQQHLRLHYLRSCPQCVADGIENFGVPHWRRAHQLPGVYRCPAHGQPLSEISIKGARRLYPRLPAPTANVCDWRGYAIPAQCRASEISLRKIATIALRIGTLPADTRLDAAVLRDTYSDRLRLRGFIETWGRVRRIEAEASLLRFAGALNTHPEYPQWLNELVTRGNLIQRMVTLTRQLAQPVVHAILIAWLFESWQDFQSSYATCANQRETEPKVRGDKATRPSSDPPPSAVAPTPNGQAAALLQKQRFARLLQSGQTPSSASRCVGVSDYKGSIWAASLGIAKRFRSDSLPHTLHPELDRRLRGAESKTVIALALGLRSSTVAHYLRLNPHLRLERERSRLAVSVAFARRTWTIAIDRSRQGDIGATTLAKSAGAHYRRHDPAGFASLMANNPYIPNKFKKKAGWTVANDALCAQAIKSVARELHRAAALRDLGIWDIVFALEARGILHMESEFLLMPHSSKALKAALKAPHVSKACD